MKTAAVVFVACGLLLSFWGSRAAAAEPPTVVINPSILTTETTAEVSGTVDIHGGELTQVFIEASTDKTTWGVSRRLAKQIEEGTVGPIPFTGTLEGLEPDTNYYFRVETQNGSGSVRTVYPEVEPYPSTSTSAAVPVPPTISAESVTSVGTEAATLTATINPRRFATTYTFEYAKESAIALEGWNSPTVRRSEGLAPLPADNIGHLVSYDVTGLISGERYSWRVEAENIGGVAVGAENTFATQRQATGPLSGCPNEVLRTGFAALLPDCRAYEQVTPADKGGLYVEGYPDLLAAAIDGSAVSYISGAGSGIPTAGNGARQDTTTYLSSLSGGSWSGQSLFPPEQSGEKAGFLGTSANMHFALVQAGKFDGSSSARLGLFLIDTATQAVTQIVPYQGTQKIEGAFADDVISNDGSHVFFESRAQLTPEANPTKSNLYMWDRGTQAVTLVGVLPPGEQGEGAAPSGGSFGGAYDWVQGEFATETGGAHAGLYVESVNAGTDDGSQIYFTAGGVFETRHEGTGQLYLRRGLDGPTPTTVRVSEPQAGIEDPLVEEIGEPLPAAFQEATPDGTRAFFTSSQKLTHDATTGEFDGGRDLYRYDEQENKLVDVTGGLGGEVHPEGAKVLGLLGASSDGSSGYFGARSALAEGAVAGENNIYRFVENESGGFSLNFISDAPSPEGGSSTCQTKSGGRNWAAANFCGGGVISTYTGRTSRVSEDGMTLVFKRGEDIYRYSAIDGETVCMSCSVTGAASAGEAEMTASFFNAGLTFIPEVLPAALLTRSVSTDGARVFFQSPNALVAGDVNGAPRCNYLGHNGGLFNPTCMDVYEWEAPGAPGGSCSKPEVNGGCLYLLSTGTSDEASYFLGASADGRSAFIATTSSLVPSDKDDLYDVYRVQSDGGLASQHVLPNTPCSEETCRGPATSTPAASVPGSSSFQGQGNPKSLRRCKKGKIRRAGRCVTKHHKKHHKAGSKKSGKGRRK